ncbi:alpha/beta hydrolase [Thiohalocapsa sp. ML1]|uniref:alpha/beta hydrolase n=1 Tax=Thiohalocapsa sp. ML1 TaxID=1431688 RepID=UPI00073217D5|nr:alpha/beta hydrolase [Thiohalocapsa sp. ML1]
MNESQPSLNPLNYVNVGPHGSFGSSGALGTTPDDIRILFSHLRTADADRMIVHFHGGLVPEERGADSAERILHDYYGTTNAHPVFFIWETGALETLWRNLADIHGTKLFQQILRLLVKKLAKYAGVRVGARGAGLEPADADIEAELHKKRPFEDMDATPAQGAKGGALPPQRQLEQQLEAEMEEALSAEPELRDMLQRRDRGAERLPEDLAERPVPGAKGPISTLTLAAALARIVVRCLKRRHLGRDHGFYPTLIEEAVRELYLDDFGVWMWGNMKDVARQMWLPNGPDLDPDSHPGRLFLEELAALQRERPGFTVDLVGHSAGSIAICHLLEANAADAIGVAIRNLIFLAPAVRSDLFHETLLAAPDRCERLRVLTMDDSHECRDTLVDYVYTRSLLYLISGVLEANEPDCPILGMERFLTAAAPFDDARLVAIAQWLKAPGADRLVLSVTKPEAAPGMRSEAVEHGGFTEDDETMRSVCRLITA